jgi:tRNA (adenine57-N1/adenine58-N1)-methyltransferase
MIMGENGTKVSAPCVSPFLSCSPQTTPNSLAVLHLKRDLHVPIVLKEQDEHDEGYDEGKVTNTRFGSFPHSTLIGLSWGSQVRASAVDTGSRGRRKKKEQKVQVEEKPSTTSELHGGTKRQHDGSEDSGELASKKPKIDPAERATSHNGPNSTAKAAVEASTGFVHILPPTPESWTTSLPHRTQVVYVPDYSYILQRLRVTPGTTILEAGAGSGSFTHAAARAVFYGYPEPSSGTKRKRGKVWSFEFHEQRAEKLKEEIAEHGLESIVTLTHRDVCRDGFQVMSNKTPAVAVDAIFLDLPAPWLALKHLTRQANSHSALNQKNTVRICTFSPCIEQVQRTVSAMRSLGWREISMIEIAAKRIEIRRERVGLQEEGLRGVNPAAANVDEAIAKLKEIETRNLRNMNRDKETPEVDSSGTDTHGERYMGKQARLAQIKEALNERKLYKEGRLVHRAEGELKTHTSYLVFALLPQEWTEGDEARAKEKWGGKVEVKDSKTKSVRQMKKDRKADAGGNNLATMAPKDDNRTAKTKVEDQ